MAANQYFINPYKFGVPLLLDTYSGAAAAYSLRRLNTAYTGPVVQVRRSGDSAEDTFSAVEVGDGTLAAWVTAGGGTEDGFVKTWYDQSGNGNDASQATAGSQPQIVASGAVVLENGEAALDFDGVNHKLSGSNFINGTGNRSGLVVYKPNNTLSTNNICDLSSATSGTGVNYSLTPEVSLRTRGVTYVTTVGTTSQSLLSVYQSAQLIQTGVALYYQGQFATRESGTDGTIDTENSDFFIGALNAFYSGTIQELVFYSSDQSSNRTGIESNIASHYGITLS